MELLVASGADANVKDDRNNTPLDLAKRRRRAEIIEILTKAAERQQMTEPARIIQIQESVKVLQ